MKMPRFRGKSRAKTTSIESFSDFVEKITKNGGGIAYINRKDPEDSAKRFVASKEIKDLKDSDILTLLRNQYGGGDYVVELAEFDGALH